MKNLLLFVCICLSFYYCKPSHKGVTTNNMKIQDTANDTLRIANDSLEYEIIIIEPGFNAWMMGRARPEGYYSQEFLENRNYLMVTEWNNRVLNPQRYNPNLYQLQIDYSRHIDYGYEVNYKLYYYFIYFQMQYKQRLSAFVPRI